MVKTRLTFDELLDTIHAEGYDLLDGNDIPVDVDLESALEDDNLVGEAVEVNFRRVGSDAEDVIVADVHVRDEVYHVVGRARDVGVLQNRIRGIARLGS